MLASLMHIDGSLEIISMPAFPDELFILEEVQCANPKIRIGVKYVLDRVRFEYRPAPYEERTITDQDRDLLAGMKIGL